MKKRSRFLVLTLVAIVGLTVAAGLNVSFPGAHAAESAKANLASAPVLERRLELIAERVKSGRAGTVEVRDLRAEIEEIVAEVIAARAVAAASAKETKALLDSLGPKPEGEGEQEAPNVEESRKKLSTEFVAFQGEEKRAGLTVALGEQLLAEFGRQSRDRLKAKLLEYRGSPFSVGAWNVAMPEFFRLAFASFVEAPKEWWFDFRDIQERRTAVVRVLIFALLAALAGWPLRRWMLTRFGRVPVEEPPRHARRLVAGLVEGTARGLIPVIFVLVVGLLLAGERVVEGDLAVVVEATTKHLILYFLAYGVINAAFSPTHHEWRITGLDDVASALFVVRLKAALTVFVVFSGLYQVLSWATMSAELEAVFALIFTVSLAPILLSLLKQRIWQPPETGAAVKPEDAEPASPSRVQRLRPLLALAFLIPPMAAAAGYPKLSNHLAQAVVLTGIGVGALWLLRYALREGVGSLLDGGQPFSRAIRDYLAISKEGAHRLTFWLGIMLDLGLLLLAGFFLLPVWGLGLDETVAWAGKLFRGVQIGSFTFSLLDIVVAMGLFAGVVVITRLIQRGLERHILPNLTHDRGVQDALKTATGYVGVVVAGFVGFSALGLDLSNLALIAGALSVGIGFGLQNIVNNFVSGLILLAERPIKPGDWVVIGGYEGTVKKVNVRSTEVETFQKASVILPNADLIANPVVNWTHKNVQGRVEVGVGIAYGTDEDLVEKILLQCAGEHPNVLSWPEPFVLFMNFGDSSLDFELRAFLRNVESRIRTASDLRKAISKAFRAQNIEIPFPQRVVHLVSDGERGTLPPIENETPDSQVS